MPHRPSRNSPEPAHESLETWFWMIELQSHSHSRRLKLGHQKGPVIVESHHLVLLQHSIASELPFKFDLLIMKGLPLDQPLSAAFTDGQRWRPGEPTATVPAEAAGANVTTAQAVNTTAAGAAAITYSAELRKILQRTATARAEVRYAFRRLLQRTSAIVGNSL